MIYETWNAQEWYVRDLCSIPHPATKVSYVTFGKENNLLIYTKFLA
jgi:hypothetical protein